MSRFSECSTPQLIKPIVGTHHFNTQQFEYFDTMREVGTCKYCGLKIVAGSKLFFDGSRLAFDADWQRIGNDWECNSLNLTCKEFMVKEIIE